MLSLIVKNNSFRNVEKIKCFSKFNVKFHQIHTDNLIILIKWIILLIFITTTPLCKYEDSLVGEKFLFMSSGSPHQLLSALLCQYGAKRPSFITPSLPAEKFMRTNAQVTRMMIIKRNLTASFVRLKK